MKVIELHIPNELAEYLPAEEMIVEYNIICFLRAYYMKEDLVMPCEQQYLLAAEDNREIVNDFIAADLDDWENDY